MVYPRIVPNKSMVGIKIFPRCVCKVDGEEVRKEVRRFSRIFEAAALEMNPVRAILLEAMCVARTCEGLRLMPRYIHTFYPTTNNNPI